MKSQTRRYEQPEEAADQTIIDYRPDRLKAKDQESLPPLSQELEEKILNALRKDQDFKTSGVALRQKIETSILMCAQKEQSFFTKIQPESLAPAISDRVKEYLKEEAVTKINPHQTMEQRLAPGQKRYRAEAAIKQQEEDLAQLKLDNARQRLRRISSQITPEAVADEPKTIIQKKYLRSVPATPVKKNLRERFRGWLGL